MSRVVKWEGVQIDSSLRIHGSQISLCTGLPRELPEQAASLTPLSETLMSYIWASGQESARVTCILGDAMQVFEESLREALL